MSTIAFRYIMNLHKHENKHFAKTSQSRQVLQLYLFLYQLEKIPGDSCISFAEDLRRIESSSN